MGRRPKSEEQTEATEELIENSVEVNEVEPPSKEEEPVEKPKPTRPKREKTPAQLAAWEKLQAVNKKKFEDRRAAKERGEVVIPHGRNIDKQSKQVLEKLEQQEKEPTPPPKKVIKQEIEEEEEIEYVKAPPKKPIKKKKRRIVVEQDSSSSEEEIVISRRRSKSKKNTPTLTAKPTSPITIPQETPKEDPIEKEKISSKPPEEKKYTPTEILRGLGL